ncbi:MAG: hypothetical protein KJ064_27440, partial [Anaerolineae bacterium]|nr:hypothetical protein [Anaerolineae bacterium]
MLRGRVCDSTEGGIAAPPAQRKSFTLKQTGWKLLEGNKIQIRGRTYKLIQHRPMSGTVKTLTVKRDAAGRLWLFFSVIEQVIIPNGVTPGKI